MKEKEVTQEQFEKERAQKKAYDQAMQARMMNAAQGMMNAGQLGSGYGGGAQQAQGSVALAGSWPSAGAITAGTIHPGPLVSTQSMKNNIAPKRSRVRMDVSIEQAANGYVLTFGGAYAESTESHIATTFEDINTIINSELASRLLDKVS